MTYRSKIYVAIFITLIFTLKNSFSQKLSPGPQVLTFFSDADDTEQPYGLYLPKNYDDRKKYPLVIMLHGAGSNHRLALRRVFGKSNANGENDVEASRYFPEWKDIDYIVASPYARGTMGYQGIAEKDVYDVLADVKKRFSIDEDRTYLTGLSMGGGGTLWIGLTRPDIWAAIAPVCPAPPKGTDALAPNALHLPSHFFHGDEDRAVAVSVSRDWVKRLKDLESNVEYTEYPGVGHNSWENAYKDEAIFEWFGKFKRNRFPDRVRFNTTHYKYNSAYWISIDQIIPGALASIDAKFAATNTLAITTTGLGAFTLKLAGHSKFIPNQPVHITINGKKITVAASEIVSFKQQDGKWTNGLYEAPAYSKKKDAEGPIREAFSSRHIYVYGTGGSPTEEEMRVRIEMATRAGNWSQYRNAFLGRIMFFPRIVADRDVRPSDFESANLILFGTKETNLIIEKYSNRLPFHLNADSKDHGLFYVFPIDGHYVAVNSGLPWWTDGQAQGLPFLPQPYMLIDNFKDFILFKGSSKNVIAEGYFDVNWKLSEKDRQALISASPITLKK